MIRLEGREGRANGGVAPGHAIAWGVGVAALYVITAVISGPWSVGPVRILYDGLAPLPPYRWVHPPPELARDNQAPEPGDATLPLTAGSAPGSVTTGDGQASVIFEENTVAPATGESAVRVSIAPMDPAAVAAAPKGTRFDGNAYTIDVRYLSSGQRVRLRAPATIVLRYATGATQMVRATGTGWSALQTLNYPGSLQLVVAKTQMFGIFTSVAPENLPYTRRIHWWVYVIAGLPVLALLLGYLPRILARFRARAQEHA
jgi:hypothetical protein